MATTRKDGQRGRHPKRRHCAPTDFEKLEKSLNRVHRKLDRALHLLEFVAFMEVKMAQELDDLELQVSETAGVAESATLLLEGIISRLDQAGTDPAKLAALKATLKARTDALAVAVANIPAAPGTVTPASRRG